MRLSLTYRKTFGSNARYVEQNSHVTANHSIAAGRVAALARHEPAHHDFDPLV
jgi:phage baseplate assembly protein W